MLKAHQYSIVIQETDLDSYGHLNNAAYLRLFEQARWDLTNSNGYGIKQISESKQGPVILEIYLKFRKELRARDQVIIETSMMEMSGKVSKVKQVMKKANGDEACEAQFTFGLFDLATRKLIEPTEAWKKAVEVK
ncbi:MAG: acyl-CoA thioesterase [Pseudobdellovibrionaceae bacterium]